jgi:hypothetical protein
MNHAIKVQEYAKHRRRIVADNIEYIVVTEPEQLLGVEISNYVVPTRLYHIKDLDYLIQRAQERMR